MMFLMPGPRRRGFGPPGRELLDGLGMGNPRFGQRGRGRRRNRGDIRAAILVLVAEQPRHGYQIIQDIAERTEGAWTPSPGSVYPTVSQLADEGLIYTEKANGRTVVHLTEHGRNYTQQHHDELAAVLTTTAPAADDEGAELRTAGRELMGATAQVAQAGSSDQLATATRLLADTRRRLYLLLAGDDPSTNAEDDPGPSNPM